MTTLNPPPFENAAEAVAIGELHDTGNGVTAVADLVAKHVRPRVMEVTVPTSSGTRESVPLLLLPSGISAHGVKAFLDPYRQAPERREGTARLSSLESFIAHTNRFRDRDSALFAQPIDNVGHPMKLVAVYDYHHANEMIPPAEGSAHGLVLQGAPRFCRHRAEYTFPISDELEAWSEHNGKFRDQSEFATFLEDRIIDVTNPEAAFSSAKRFAEALGIPSFASPSRLLQLSRGLTVSVNKRVENKINPSTGETTMHFSEEHNDEKGAPLVVPRAFLIQIPVFRFGAAFQLAARLKYRAAGSKVAWAYEIHDLDKAIETAFTEACDSAVDATGLPLFYGSPES